MPNNLGIRLKDRPPDATNKVPAYATYWDNTTDLIEHIIETIVKRGLFEGLITAPGFSRTNLVVSYDAFECITEDGIYCEPASIDVTHDAADGANPRIDILCVKPTIRVDGEGEIIATGEVVIEKGTVAAKAKVPDTPSGYLKVLEVDIPASAGEVTLRSWKPMYIPVVMFRPFAQGTPDMTVKVNFGRGYISGNALIDKDVQNSPSFTAPTADKCSIDLLHIDASGTLAITSGSEADLPNEPSAPTYPADKLVICEVYLEGGDTAIYQWQIKDVRPVMSLGAGLKNIIEDTTPQLGGDLDAQTKRIYDVKLLDFKTPAELTIAAGEITVTQTFHRIDTQDDDPSDDLVTINGEVTGRILILKAENDGRTIVVKHNTGNIWLKGKADVSLDDLEDGLLLIYSGAKWIDVGSPGTGLQNVIEDASPQLGGDLDAQTKRIFDIKWLDLKAPTELTINAGAITITQSFHKIDTDSDDPTDDLVTINGGAVGRVLVIRPEHDGRSIVVKHGTGNIWLKGKADLTLDDLEDCLILVYTPGSKWVDLGAGGGGAATFLALTDSPANYAGDGLKYVRVNVGENALEFATPAGAGDMLKATYDANEDDIIDEVKGLNLATASELTIAAGAITVTQSVHTVDTAGDAGSDDLDTINGGATVQLIILRAENDAHTVVIKHNTGNIWLKRKQDLSLDDLRDGLMLFWDGTKWIDLGAWAEATIGYSFAIPIDEPETVAGDVGVFHFAPGVAGTIEEVYLLAKVAPGGGKTLTVDVHKGGVTIFTNQGNRPSLVDAATTDTSPAPDVNTFAKNDLFTIDVDVSTGGTAVEDVIVLIRGKQVVI